MQEREEAPVQDDITRQLNAIYEQESSELDPVLRAAQARALSEVDSPDHTSLRC